MSPTAPSRRRPLAWPAPVPVKLTLYPAGSRLLLPCRPPQPREEADLPAFGDPEGAAHGEALGEDVLLVAVEAFPDFLLIEPRNESSSEFDGGPPFVDDDPMGIYQQILNGKLNFPRSIEKSAGSERKLDQMKLKKLKIMMFSKSSNLWKVSHT